MPTTLTTGVAYCTAKRLLLFCDYRYIADWAADEEGGPRPSRASLLDPTSVPGEVVEAHLHKASGDIRKALYARGHYSPEDMAALVADAAVELESLTAALTLYGLAGRRLPGGADPEKVPGAKLALAELEDLRNGTKILPLADQSEAGEGLDTAPLSDPYSARCSTVNQAWRFFGPRRGVC